MREASVAERSFCEPYWHCRAVETERQLLFVKNDHLRSVYLELLGHYRRMADLVGKPVPVGASLHCHREACAMTRVPLPSEDDDRERSISSYMDRDQQVRDRRRAAPDWTHPQRR